MTSVLALVVTPPVVPTVVVIAVPLVTPLMVVISVVVGVAVVSGDGGGVGSVGTIVYTTIVNIAARRMGWGGEQQWQNSRLPLQPHLQIVLS